MPIQTYRIRFSINGGEPKIYKIKAESFEAAKQKLINTFKFEEMLSDEEIDKTNDLLDMLLKIAKGKP